jgi:hypothetical protein
MKAQVGYTGGAAKVCDDYVNVETGTGVYSDWYLPSKNEIMQMQLNQNAINAGFVFGYYWSSSEHDYNYGLNAWVALFVSDFTVTAATKDNNITKVRAIRSF